MNYFSLKLLVGSRVGNIILYSNVILFVLSHSLKTDDVLRFNPSSCRPWKLVAMELNYFLSCLPFCVSQSSFVPRHRIKIMLGKEVMEYWSKLGH